MWDRGQQVARIGSLRRDEHLVGRSLLDDLPRLHDDDTVAQQPQHIEIVGDKEVAHTQRILQVLQKVEDHRLH